MQQQVRSLVGRKPAREAERQRVGIKQMLGAVDLLGRRADAASCLDNRSRA